MVGHICEKCKFENQKYTFKEYVKNAKIKHKNKYEYDEKSFYDKKIRIKFKKHCYFNQSKIMHLYGHGCNECANDKKRLTLKEFKERSNLIHDYEYDYSNVSYINNYTVVEIKCKKHGIFQQTPNFHMLGQGCPKCKSSRGEKKIMKYLKQNKIIYEHQKKFNECKNKNKLPFDFYIPKYNLCVEFNGKQHYEPIKYFGGQKTLDYIKNNDEIKETYCKNNHIKLVIIKYNENIIEKLNEYVR